MKSEFSITLFIKMGAKQAKLEIKRNEDQEIRKNRSQPKAKVATSDGESNFERESNDSVSKQVLEQSFGPI